MTCQPAFGHFHPMVPLASKLRDTGHEVVFVTSASFAPIVEQAGFRAIVAGLDWLESEVDHAFPDLVHDVTKWQFAPWNLVFARAAQALTGDLITVLLSLRPNLIVNEMFEFSGALAAEAVGIPHATLGIGALQPMSVLVKKYGQFWTFARRALGLTKDPNLERFSPYLYLDVYPTSMQPNPIHELSPVTQRLQSVPYAFGQPEFPSWLDQLPDQPNIYVTMGTVFNRIRGTFEIILEALRDEAMNVIVTVGINVDPSSLGHQPSHVRIERYIPQSTLLPKIDVVVCHAGYNTMIGALVHGKPMLCIPMADEDACYNAFRIAACGAGLQILPQDAKPRNVLNAIHELLYNPLYRENSLRLKQELDAMPPLDSVVSSLERIAAQDQPPIARRAPR